jgi:hypothetical protein
MKLNREAFKHAKNLIRNGKYILDSDWSEDKPSVEVENRVWEKNGRGEYRQWFLGLDTDKNPQRKGYYTFPFGDFEKVHRAGVIAAKQRAAQNDYHDIEVAADDLLELLDEREGEKA